jgi:general secretion pathway protein D
MVPDERLNALIVVATTGMMERVRDLIIKLDTPTPYEANNLHIYELLNADAEQVETALQGIVGTAPRAQSGGGAGGAAAAAGGGGGGGATAEVTPFERKIQITRYDQTNSLLIVASPQDYKHLESFIARLDVPQRQVHVDAMIMRVRTTNDFLLDVDAAGITGNDGFGITNSNNIAGLAAGLAPVTDTANALAGNPQVALASGLLSLGASNTFTAGLFDEITIEVDGVDVDVPFVPLLMTALETLTDVEVLSQPSLVTVDNEEASIVIGQEIPFVTGTGSPQTSNEGSLISTGFTRVEREEVGVKLKVTPQISEGDYVALQLEVEKSNVASNPVGDVNILGPTTDKSIVMNKVVVKDGATAVIGGLTEDTVDRSRSYTPVLGELPVVGWLFGRRSNNQSRSNIVVLVTPHIIKEGVDYERVTEYKVNEYHDAQLDLLFDKGFFEGFKRKRDKRKNYRPTLNKVEAISGRPTVAEGEQFRRGDIKR